MEERPAELVAVDDPEVDPVALAARVRDEAERLRAAGAVFAPPPPVVAAADAERAAGPWVHPLAASAEIRPYGPLRGALAPLKKAVRRALRWYLWPVTAQLSGHNRAVADVLAEHRRQLAVATLDAERLRAELELR